MILVPDPVAGRSMNSHLCVCDTEAEALKASCEAKGQKRNTAA